MNDSIIKLHDKEIILRYSYEWRGVSNNQMNNLASYIYFKGID